MSKSNNKSKRDSAPIKIRYKERANGSKTIYFDYWDGGTAKRMYQFTDLIIVPPTTQQAIKQNDETMMIAEAMRSQLYLDIVSGKANIQRHKVSKIRFIDFIDWYIENQSSNIALKTIESYESTKSIIKNYNENLLLSQIDKQQLLRIIAFFKSMGLKDSTQSLYISKMGTLFKKATKMGYMTKNPVSDLERNERPRGKQFKRVYLEIDEVRRLMETDCQESVKRPFLFSCFCGLRWVDICGLKWSDIKVIGGRKTIDIVMQKTKTHIEIPLTTEALNQLPQPNGQEKVFGNLKKILATETTLKKWCKRANIEKNVTFHSARHTFATMLVTKGVDIYTISKLLGHTDVKTTQIYAEIVGQKKREAVEVLDNIFNE